MTDRHCHNTEEQDPAESEQVYLIKVITAFASYKRFSLNNNHRRRRDYLSLPEHHKKLIPDFLDKVNKVDECIEHNMTFIRDIVKSANMFLDPSIMEHSQQKVHTNTCTHTYEDSKCLSIIYAYNFSCIQVWEIQIDHLSLPWIWIK